MPLDPNKPWLNPDDHLKEKWQKQEKLHQFMGTQRDPEGYEKVLKQQAGATTAMDDSSLLSVLSKIKQEECSASHPKRSCKPKIIISKHKLISS